jgi:beta-N-acetylhexosaminidase
MITTDMYQRTRRARRGPIRSARRALRVRPLLLVSAIVTGVLAGVAVAYNSGPAGPTSAGPAGAGQPAAGPAGTGPAGAGTAGAGQPAAGAAALPNLTVAQMAGQRVIYSYAGLTPPATLLSLIRHGEVAGVIFFGGNISSRAQIAGVIKQLDQANRSTQNPLRARPLLLMTDQEGGQVRRLPGAPLLSEKQIGQSAHPAAEAKAAGLGAGQNLAGVGMNLNLAPVLDVFRTPGNFIDEFGRSYSNDPHKVSYLGADFIKAQQPVGVAATAKHFPGLGAATRSQNTDLRPVTLRVSLNALRTVDEYPYRAAISAGVKLVMLSWAIYPALASRPAGLSSTIIRGELRKRLGFTGVTITDAIEAGALQPFGTIQHRATLAARAGMDLILCSGQRVAEGEQARTALADGYRNGTLGKSAFQAAVNRVLALRSSP